MKYKVKEISTVCWVIELAMSVVRQSLFQALCEALQIEDFWLLVSVFQPKMLKLEQQYKKFSLISTH